MIPHSETEFIFYFFFYSPGRRVNVKVLTDFPIVDLVREATTRPSTATTRCSGPRVVSPGTVPVYPAATGPTSTPSSIGGVGVVTVSNSSVSTGLGDSGGRHTRHWHRQDTTTVLDDWDLTFGDFFVGREVTRVGSDSDFCLFVSKQFTALFCKLSLSVRTFYCLSRWQ